MPIYYRNERSQPGILTLGFAVCLVLAHSAVAGGPPPIRPTTDEGNNSDRWDGFLGMDAPAADFGIHEGQYSRVAQLPVPGDSNCDGVVDFNDIEAFVAALIHESVWRIAHDDAQCDFIAVNDLNADGRVDFADVDSFILVLID